MTLLFLVKMELCGDLVSTDMFLMVAGDAIKMTSLRTTLQTKLLKEGG